MVCLAKLVYRFLLHTMNLAGCKYFAELTLEQFATLFSKYLENIAAQHFTTWKSQLSKLPISIPGCNPKIAIYHVQRQRERVDNCFGETLLHFCLGSTTVDFF